MKVPEPVKDLINRFFKVHDASSNDVLGRRLSEELFTSDGVWANPKTTYTGTSGKWIALPSILNADMAIELRQAKSLFRNIKSRQHAVEKVYICSEDANDLLMFGNLEVEFLDGRVVTQGFCARAVVDDPRAAKPMLKLLRGYTASRSPSLG